jgi:hypothetical protein
MNWPAGNKKGLRQVINLSEPFTIKFLSQCYPARLLTPPPSWPPSHPDFPEQWRKKANRVPFNKVVAPSADLAHDQNGGVTAEGPSRTFTVFRLLNDYSRQYFKNMVFLSKLKQEVKGYRCDFSKRFG